MVVALFALFSQIGPMVLLISPEQIKLENCACAQIEARGQGNRWVYGIRHFCFIRKAGYCIIEIYREVLTRSILNFFAISHHYQPYYRDEGFCFTTDFLLKL